MSLVIRLWSTFATGFGSMSKFVTVVICEIQCADLPFSGSIHGFNLVYYQFCRNTFRPGKRQWGWQAALGGSWIHRMFACFPGKAK